MQYKCVEAEALISTLQFPYVKHPTNKQTNEVAYLYAHLLVYSLGFQELDSENL